ncbi:MAG: V-type ATPase subunit, partial [Dehalococcoidales bacterium]|nr:V-type ATPase subunit [Dehalococcoidales bacterium]
MLDARHAFISAYLKGEEAKIVTARHIDMMAKTSSIENALAIIAETDLGNYLEGAPIKTFGNLDECLWSYLGRQISDIEAFKFLPDDILKVMRAYLLKYDVHNIKAALHGRLSGKSANMIPLGIIYNCGLLNELSGARDTGSIIEMLVQCQLGDYIP